MKIEEEALIKKIVKETVHETLETLGLEVADPREVQADQHYLRKLRKGSQDINIYLRRSAIWAALCTIAYLAVEGVKYWITKTGG